MDRRKFLKCFSTLTVFSFTTPVVAQLPNSPVVLRQHVAPDAVEVVFSPIDLNSFAGPSQLYSNGNALWVHELIWEDKIGTRHSQTLRRNLPPGKAMELPSMPDCQKLIISVTCLPLANAVTVVELVGCLSACQTVANSSINLTDSLI